MEALATDAHAGRYAACPTAVGDHPRDPHQTAFVVLIVTAHWTYIYIYDLNILLQNKLTIYENILKAHDTEIH